MAERICSMPAHKYFELINPRYVYLQIKPHKSTRNYNSVNIAQSIQKAYKTIWQRVKRENKKFFIKANFKIAYVVDIRKNNTTFYFVVPVFYLESIEEKIREIWPKVELNIVPKIDGFTSATMFWQLNNKKEDALSLKVDRKSNEPLNSILNVMNIMQGEDRITLVYNFIPKPQWNWQKQYEDTRKKIENMQVIVKDKKTPEYLFKAAMSFINYIFNSVFQVFNDFAGSEEKVNTVFSELLVTTEIIEINKRLSDATITKKNKTVIDTQILLASDSVDKIRQERNAQSVSQSFGIISEDGGNELIAKRVKPGLIEQAKIKLKLEEAPKVISLEDYKFKDVGENIFSCDEAQNFIS